jgi:hypothetical protein
MQNEYNTAPQDTAGKKPETITTDNPGQQPTSHAQAEVLLSMPPLADQIVDKAIDNMTRKLVAGYRNKKNAKPNSKHTDYIAESKEALAAVSAESVMAVANRGQAWKEMIQKSLSVGISSLDTIILEPGFKIKDGQCPPNFKDLMPNSPGVYVVYSDRTGRPVYVGDSGNMRERWYAGHFNAYKQGNQEGQHPYKLADVMQEGCTVKFIQTESIVTAAAIESHLIKENFKKYKGVIKKSKNLTETEQQSHKTAIENGMLLNSREELATEQGLRSNQEAKKLKDASENTSSLVAGAASEAMKNVGYDLIERLTTTTIKSVKAELTDILRGGKAKIARRLERMLRQILGVLEGVLKAPLQLLRGIVEFVVNALSKAIGQIYNLARNLFDLAHGAWNLYQGAQTLTREELVRKVTETIVVSGSLILWDAMDPVIEAQLVALGLGPFAPFVASAIVAIGFGLSSFSLQKIVTFIIDALIAFKQGFCDTLDAARAASDQLIKVAEQELLMLADLRAYATSSVHLMDTLVDSTRLLSLHRAIQPLDVRTTLPGRS